jgi:CTP-dependent riboflavin kinase
MHSPVSWVGRVRSGAGGASKAFVHADERRIGELEHILGFRPYPGTLNVSLDRAFDWRAPHLSGEVLELVDRRAGLDSEWAPRLVRLYPVRLDGNCRAWALRWDADRYRETFLELVAPTRLRDCVGATVTVEVDHDE